MLVLFRYAGCFTGPDDTVSVRQTLNKQKISTRTLFDPKRPEDGFWIATRGGVRLAMATLGPWVLTDASDWQGALDKALMNVRRRVDVVFLFSRLGQRETVDLARRFGPTGKVDAILVSPSVSTDDLPATAGGIPLCRTQDRGQALTLLEAKRAGRGRWHVSWRLEMLDGAYSPEPTIAALVGRYYESHQPAGSTAPPEKPLTQAAYAPAGACKPCHRKAYEVWWKSAHSRAVESLQKKKRLVPECLTRHSEQFRRTKQFYSPESDEDGVQCATCHGDGFVHVLMRGEGKLRTTVTCEGCHAPQHSPGFRSRSASITIEHGR